MAEDDTYDLMPHRQIEDLKQQFEDLKKKSISSQEMLDSMNKLTATMDSMLKLFTQAAEELKLEEKEESETALKVDSVINTLEEIKNQNHTLAEGLVTVSDMVREHKVKHEIGKPSSGTQPPEPSFQHPEPSFQQPPPNFQHPEPSFQQPPENDPSFSQQMQTGPVPMPSIPFPELEKEPKKKGLFSRLKKSKP